MNDERRTNGTQTEEEIIISADGMSQFELSDGPLGENREDKKVSRTNIHGDISQTSSIMMGYNKKGIDLPNGIYVSWEELEVKLVETLSSSGEEEVTLKCKKTGKTVEIDSVITEVFERAIEKAHLIQRETDKITNQQAASMAVVDKGKEYSKGISMLGNDGVEFSRGQYVQLAEIQAALAAYMKVSAVVPIDIPEKKDPSKKNPRKEDPSKKEPKKEDPIEEDTDEHDHVYEEPPKLIPKEEKHTVIKRIVQKFSWIPLVTALGLEAIFGFGTKDINKTQEMMREAERLGYRGTAIVQSVNKEYETAEEVEKRLLGNVEIGEEIFVPAGVDYYESSDWQYGGANKMGTFGSTIRPEGTYNVDSFSIIANGKIEKVTWQAGMDLYETLEKVSAKTGVPVDQLEGWMHIGGPVSGWVDVRTAFTEEQLTPQVVSESIILDEEFEFEGSIDDFKGDTITINNAGNDVTLKIKKDDGTFVQPGETVIGSDGQQYRMDDLDSEKIEVISQGEIVTETKTNWSLSNITALEHLTAASVAIIGTILSLRKKKELTEMTKTQIDALVYDKKSEFYKKYKDEYKAASEFEKSVETVTNSKIRPGMTADETLTNNLIGQDITVEDIQNMGGVKK